MTRHSPEAPLFGARWAAGLGGALLLGFAGVTAFGIHDRMRLATLETVTEPTAVGDSAFVAPASRELGMTVLTWNGAPLRLADLKDFKASDPTMLKAGMDDTHAFFIYKLSPPGDSAYYVKTRTGGYLKVAH